MARRAGLRVAHLEAGLRSGSYLHPFPEELIRVATMRMAHLLYAPGDEAVTNLEKMGVNGEIVNVGANTVEEALRASIAGYDPAANGGPVVATMHRVENLKRAGRVDGFVDLLERVANEREVMFVAHGPTMATLQKRQLLDRLDRAGVQVTTLLPHAEFTRALSAADFVITDGGSIQEECALLGTPTLVWRQRTERSDGLGANVVLSRYDPVVIDTFLEDPHRIRVPRNALTSTPSEIILQSLVEALDATGADT
jgi:UDP-N-acetylglucosamine 2-epimerase (non-hydrolysing)